MPSSVEINREVVLKKTIFKRRHSIFAFRDPYLKQMVFPLRKTRVLTFCANFGSN